MMKKRRKVQGARQGVGVKILLAPCALGLAPIMILTPLENEDKLWLKIQN